MATVALMDEIKNYDLEEMIEVVFPKTFRLRHDINLPSDTLTVPGLEGISERAYDEASRVLVFLPAFLETKFPPFGENLHLSICNKLFSFRCYDVVNAYVDYVWKTLKKIITRWKRRGKSGSIVFVVDHYPPFKMVKKSAFEICLEDTSCDLSENKPLSEIVFRELINHGVDFRVVFHMGRAYEPFEVK